VSAGRRSRPRRRRADFRLQPLRPFDRVVAGYATLAFALGGGKSATAHEWGFALLGTVMAGAGVALLLLDHRRWRTSRRARATDEVIAKVS
jgi:hypothetical protein